MMENKEVVLVTGCSTGIGHDICEIMTDKGYIVAATARNIDSLKDVQEALKLKVDVTDKESINSAVDYVMKKFGKIDVLINNAGYSIRGAVEEMEADNLRKLFDVNVFGIINMIQAVLPEMRKAKHGKIINIGSISGRFTQSVNGGYCASKHAVEAVSDALRLELNKFNVQSTVIEPGPMQTSFFDTLSKTSNNIMENSNSPYYDLYKNDMEYRKIQKRTDSKKAAQQICEIIMKDKLKARYKVAVPFAFKVLLKLPDSVKEFILLHH